jgi:hypothetical protein
MYLVMTIITNQFPPCLEDFSQSKIQLTEDETWPRIGNNAEFRAFNNVFSSSKTLFPSVNFELHRPSSNVNSFFRYLLSN